MKRVPTYTLEKANIIYIYNNTRQIKVLLMLNILLSSKHPCIGLICADMDEQGIRRPRHRVHRSTTTMGNSWLHHACDCEGTKFRPQMLFYDALSFSNLCFVLIVDLMDLGTYHMRSTNLALAFLPHQNSQQPCPGPRPSLNGAIGIFLCKCNFSLSLSLAN